MSVSLYQASVGVYQVALPAFSAILDKAAAYAAARKFDPSVYMTTRLRPDMLTFARQVQTFCDTAKNASGRLAGVTPPSMPDDEASLDELKARIQKTLDFLRSLGVKDVEAGADRDIVFPVGPNKMKMKGSDYILHWATPNFYFHLTAAYAILRYAGVEIGKRDFMGAVPGVGPA